MSSKLQRHKVRIILITGVDLVAPLQPLYPFIDQGHPNIQDDPSGWSKPPVDIKTNVAFQYMLLKLKRNFCFDVNRRLGPT